MSRPVDTTTHEEPAVKDVKDDAGTKGLEVVYSIAVPPDALVAILWNLENFPRLFPDIKEARLVGGSGHELDVAYRVNAIIKEVSYVLRRTLDPVARTITWRELSGDLKRVRGAWKIAPTSDPGVSIATYSAFVDIGRFVPTSVVRDASIRKVGEMVARVRKVAAEIHAAGAGT